MDQFGPMIMGAFGFWSAFSRQSVLTPEQFTIEYAEELRRTSPALSVQIVKDLELNISTGDRRSSSAFLNNAYELYKQDPRAKNDVIAKFISGFLESLAEHAGIDRSRIIPVIKDRPWLAETRNALIKRGAKDLPEYVSEDFSPDLVILYAEDNPKSIRYFTAEQLEESKIERKDLRKLACENLVRILPKIECGGGGGLYFLRAGGDDDASLLLVDAIWEKPQMEVEGEVVVAIPTRDLLLVTGTGHAQHLKYVREMAQKAFSEGSYRLTPKLFVYRNGKFSNLDADN
jgi:uncharacterized protein YtpQ (UPF0354 family)